MGRSRQSGAIATVEALSREELAIARSVFYASLFDYPLTLAQLRQTLIECALTPSQILAAYNGSQSLHAAIAYDDGFFFPKGRRDLIAERRRRETRSREFLRQHRLLLALICSIPYVRMVALSGSVAHLNLESSGDLDVFIVTRGRRVWSVTVAIVVLAKLMRRRRFLCANYVVADSRLELDQQDLFTASQIVHLKPLVGADVYRRFVAANPFVGRFYPNFHPGAAPLRPRRHHTILGHCRRLVEIVLTPFAGATEWVCRSAYRAYLLRRASSWRSPEQVRLEPDCLKLHTQSHRQSILERFDRTVRQILPTGPV